MKLKNKFLLGSFLIIFIIILLIFTIAMWVIRSPFPTVEGSIEIPGIKEEVSIYRDNYGISHIYANNKEDMLFAQGYVHGQDRFWQMECARRLAAGQLAAVVGESALESDIYMRTVGLNRRAEEMMQYYLKSEPQIIEDLQFYIAGINAYLKENKTSISLDQHVFNLVGTWDVEEWTIKDSVLYSLYISWLFGTSWDSEQNTSILQNKLDPDIFDVLVPDYPHNRPFVTDQEGYQPGQEMEPLRSFLADPFDKTVNQAYAVKAVMQTELTRPLSPNGSNAWVISGEYTDNGLPILANDAHLWVSMPSNWYMMSLHCPEYDVIGYSFPGSPGIIIGRNKTVSWGITNSMVDVQDLFRLRVNEDNPGQYDFNGEWLNFIINREVIKVSGGEDYVLEVKQSHYGPVISEDSGYDGEVLTLRWEGYEKNTRIFKAIMNMNKAADCEEFRNAISEWDSPSICFLFADVNNNIAMQLTGNIPKRNYETTRIPLPGWTNDYEWTGWYDFEELPSQWNPEKGYIVSANNQYNEENIPCQFLTIPGNRAQRASDMIKEKIVSGVKITADYCLEMQTDTYSLFANDYVSLFRNLYSEDEELNIIIRLLSSWDCRMEENSREAAVFAMFTNALVYNIYHDELSEAEYELYKNNYNLPIYLSLQNLSKEEYHTFWDNKDTPDVETRDDILEKSLSDAVEYLEGTLGKEFSEWKWGDIHKVSFTYAPLGMSGIKPIENFVNRGGYSVGGDPATLNNFDWHFNNIGNVGMHPSMRWITDLSNIDSNQGILAIGQSGHPSHKNYDNMIPLWIGGDNLPLPLSENQIKVYPYQLILKGEKGD